MNREEMIADTEEKLKALRAGYEEYLLLEEMLKFLKRPAKKNEQTGKRATSIADFIKGVFADGKPHKAREIVDLMNEAPEFAWRNVNLDALSSRLSQMARDGVLVKLPRGQGYQIAPDKKEKG